MTVNSDILKEANVYKVINTGLELQNLVIALLESVKFESSGIFSTTRAFHRQEKAGAHSTLFKAMKEHSIRARVLVPMDKSIIKILSEYKKQGLNVDIKHIEKGTISIFIVDKKHALIAELQDDSKDDSFEAVSRVVYTNSPSSVSFYASLFESFWEQAKLYERTRDELDKTRSEMTQMKYYVMDLMDEMSMIRKNNKMSSFL